MKKFNEWLEEKINEVSSDVLKMAASKAIERRDPRGDRMARAFTDTAKRREKQGTFRSGKPLNKDNFNIVFYYEQERYDYNTMGRNFGRPMTKPIELLVTKMEYKNPIMIEGLSKEFGRVFISIEENKHPLKIRAASTLGRYHLQDNTPLFLDRNGAKTLAEKLTELKSYSVEEDSVFIPFKPTDFPLI